MRYIAIIWIIFGILSYETHGFYTRIKSCNAYSNMVTTICKKAKRCLSFKTLVIHAVYPEKRTMVSILFLFVFFISLHQMTRWRSRNAKKRFRE
ncbi:hypothetical protein BCV72DRAFT_29610 [Rhizopus microsporus var. microsporus]|uniref:Uncharacterized protein n=1 Tax=Rhizopus microsporus var. microsporus TaxID=86635 RepID=A0A1X0QUU4_RHIZD|nr:hypothetical protein BCV72DRAFT_29610 [Rhizopus microsporus var. microsporus]